MVNDYCPDFSKASPADITRAAAEAQDPRQVEISCELHGYKASHRPPLDIDCQSCWQAWMIYDIASVPPSMRKERLEHLERAIRKAAEQGTAFDYKGFGAPKIASWEKEK